MLIHLPEIVVPGQRLGRHIDHDPRSLRYALPESAPTSVQWERYIPILNQGDLGSGTGNAMVGALGSGPLHAALAAEPEGMPNLDEAEAVAIYSDAEKLDGGRGYPPEDDGSSGLSVAKVAVSLALISGYQHATSVAAAHTAIQAGPFITGTNWLTGMDTPSSEGVVSVTGKVRGGHEYVCREYDAAHDLWWFDNSWGTSWGLQGRFAYDSAAMERLLGEHGDITALVPLDKPAPTPTPAPSPQPVGAADSNLAAAFDAWAPTFWARWTASGKLLITAGQAWEKAHGYE